MAKFKGTRFGDLYGGTNKADFIDGKDGDDTLFGAGGDDRIKGGKGNDLIDGGAGDDRITGGKGDDTVNAGGGSDRVDAGKGDDLVIYTISDSASGPDTLWGGKGSDTLLLEFTLAQWLDPAWQEDVAAFLAHVAGAGPSSSGKSEKKAFTFHDGTVAGEFENLRVIVDGVELNPADEAVTARDDAATLSEDDGATLFTSVLGNDDVPDLVRSVALMPGSGPAKGVVVFNADGSFSFDPAGDFDDLAVGESRAVSFDYEVIDANGDSAVATVTITVTGANDAPVISVADGDSDAVSLDEANAGLTATGRLTLTDVDTTDTVGVAVTGLTVSGDVPAGLSDQATLAAMLTLTPEAVLDGTETEGSFAWTFASGAETFTGMKLGETLTLAYEVTATDQSGATDTQMVTVTIVGTNTDPVFAGDPALADGATGNLADPFAPIDIAALFTDAEGDALTFTATGLPAGFSLSAGGILTRTSADPAGAGDHVLTVTANDGRGGVTTQELTLSVALEHDFGDSFATGVPATVTGGSADDTIEFGANAADRGDLTVETGAGNDQISFGIETALRGGKVLVDAADGADTISFESIESNSTLLAGAGADKIVIGRIADGNHVIDLGAGDSAQDEVTIQAFSGNLTIRNWTAGEDILSFANDMFWTVEEVGGDTVFTSANFDRITFEGVTGVDYALMIPGLNLNAPEFTGDPALADGATGNIAGAFEPVDIGALFTDAEGDALTFSATGLPAGFSLSAGGILTRDTADPAGAGDHVITVTANDGRGGVTTQELTLSVALENDFEPIAFARGGTVTGSSLDDTVVMPGLVASLFLEVIVDTGGGDDDISFGISAAYDGGSVIVRAGDGADSISFAQGSGLNGGNIHVEAGSGADRLYFDQIDSTFGTHTIDLGASDGAVDELIIDEWYTGTIVIRNWTAGEDVVRYSEGGLWTVEEVGGDTVLTAPRGYREMVFEGVTGVDPALLLPGANLNAPEFIGDPALAAGAAGNLAGPNAPVDVGALFTDAEGDTLTFSATGLPAGFVLSRDGILTGTSADPLAAGDHAIRVTANDGRGGVTTQDLTLTITLANEYGSDFARGGNQSIQGSSAGDELYFGDNAAANGGVLTISTGDGNDFILFGENAAFSGGTIHVDAGAGADVIDLGFNAGVLGGSVVFDLGADDAPDLVTLLAGGVANVTIRNWTALDEVLLTRGALWSGVDDGTDTTFTNGGQSITFEGVTGVDFDQLLEGHNFSAPEFTGDRVIDAGAVGSLAAANGPVDIGAMFSDGDGDALTFTAVGLPAGFALSVNGTLTVPAAPTAGDHVTTVTASDGRGGVTSETLTLAIALMNDFGDGFATTQTQVVAGSSLTDRMVFGDDAGRTLGNLTVNAFDGADEIIFGDGAASNFGNLTVNAGDGADSVSFGANAGRDGFVTVNAGAGADRITFGSGAGISGGILVNFGGTDGALDHVSFDGTVGYVVIQNWAAGEDAVVLTGNTALWTASDNGIDILFTSNGGETIAFDGATGADPSTMLQGANFSAPVFAGSTELPSASTGNLAAPFLGFDAATLFSDPDGDTLVFSATGLPAGYSLSASGYLSRTSSTATEVAGDHTVTITASDGRGGVTSQDFDFSVALYHDYGDLFANGTGGIVEVHGSSVTDVTYFGEASGSDSTALYVYMGEGNDFASFGNSPASRGGGIYVEAGAGNDSVTFGTNALFGGGWIWVEAGDGNDTITLNGSALSVPVTVDSGYFYIEDGAGDDIIIIDEDVSAGAVYLDLRGDGVDTLYVDADWTFEWHIGLGAEDVLIFT